jgi:hypothetical protein
LLRRDLRDEIDAVLEAVDRDDPMQQIGLQPRRQLGQAMNELVRQG